MAVHYQQGRNKEGLCGNDPEQTSDQLSRQLRHVTCAQCLYLKSEERASVLEVELSGLKEQLSLTLALFAEHALDSAHNHTPAQSGYNSVVFHRNINTMLAFDFDSSKQYWISGEPSSGEYSIQGRYETLSKEVEEGEGEDGLFDHL